jgi:hypothetical protein
MTLPQEKEALLNRRLETANAALRATQHEPESSRQALLRLTSNSARMCRSAGYVRSLLPPPMSLPFAIDWRFVPSASLGGEAFGHNWIDPDHFPLAWDRDGVCCG